MDPQCEQDISVEGRIVGMFFAIRPSDRFISSILEVFRRTRSEIE